MSRLMALAVAVGAVGAVAGLGISGCGERDAPPTAAPTPEATRPGAGFDAKALTEKLQGEWRVGSTERVTFRFAITGDDVTVTDLQFGAPSVQTGKLVVLGPHEIGVQLADGTVYRYKVVQIGDTMHIGLGLAADVESLDGFTLELGRFEKLTRGPEGCRWIRKFERIPEEREVSCSLTEVEGRRVFRFQAPDPFDKDALAQRELFVFGTILIDEQLLGSVATR